jgi:hypothetical protein
MKTILLFLFLFIISTYCFSQTQIKENRKVYKDENGKLYVQKTLPVYLWLSNSKDSLGEKVLLSSQTTPEFSNPMYFDTDGYNSVHVKGQVNHKTKALDNAEKDVVYEVYGDSNPPDSYVIIQSKHNKYSEGKRVYLNECILDILSYDMFAGVGKIYYSVNNNEFQEYSDQLSITDKGDIIIKYYAVDNVGNIEEVKEISFKIEK